MSTIQNIFEAWNATAQINPPPSLDDATDTLQTFAPTVSDADSDAWWNAVAAEINRVASGEVNPGTYIGLRNWADGNEANANELFAALVQAIQLLSETDAVQQGLDIENNSVALAEIPGNITDITNLKTGGTSVKDVQFDTALDAAITSLQELQERLSR
jgi:hypothetical protein